LMPKGEKSPICSLFALDGTQAFISSFICSLVFHLSWTPLFKLNSVNVSWL
jgi:hypothetical protein